MGMGGEHFIPGESLDFTLCLGDRVNIFYIFWTFQQLDIRLRVIDVVSWVNYDLWEIYQELETLNKFHITLTSLNIHIC